MSRETSDAATEHLSVSQAKQCLAKTGFEKIAGIREAPSAAMDFGTYVHALAEASYRNSAVPAPVPEGMNRKTQEKARALFAEYWNQIGKSIVPNATFIEYRFNLESWTKRPIIGYIDLGYAVNGSIIVADLKTKGRAPDAIRDDEKLQLATYRAALGLPIPGPAELHILVTDGEPEVYTLEAGEDGERGVTVADVEHARARFVVLDHAYDTKMFPPEPSKLCQYCAAYQYCQGGKTFDGDINAWIAKRAALPGGPVTDAKDQVKAKEKEKENVMVKIEKSSEVEPYLKVAIFGEPGTLKTRTALAFPSPLVVDTEHGTDHYTKEFDFSRVATTNPKDVEDLMRQIAADPNGFRTFLMDSWSVYCEAMTSYFTDIYQEKEKTSAGNKGDYYRLQPRDYQPINKRLMAQVKAMLRLRMHVVLTMQVKDDYDGMEKKGVTYDGYKRSPYYMDTVIHVKKSTDPKTGAEILRGHVIKDRTHRLPKVIDNFGIDTLRTAWKDYFERDAVKADNVFEDEAPAAPMAVPAAPTAEKTTPVPAPAPAASTVVEEPASAKKSDQLAALLELRGMLAIPDEQWQSIIEKRHVKKAERLGLKDVIELLGKLEAKLAPEQMKAWIEAHPFRAPNA